MKTDLSNVKQILENFVNQIQKREEVFKSVRGLVDDPDHKANINRWTREECDIWINAEPYSYLLQKEAKSSIPAIFQENALKYYKIWLEKCLDIQNDEKYIIRPPIKTYTLLKYLHFLYEIALIKPRLKERWKLSLRSFCDFLRREYLQNNAGFLNVIFPQKMDFFNKAIIRKIPLEVYPIDIVDTQVILKQLAHNVINGRPNVQKTMTEVLALCWICLICANYRTITELKLLVDGNITFKNLIKQETPKEKVLFGKADHYSDLESYYIIMPTLFFEEKLRISKTLYDYLNALCEVNQGKIFSSPLRSLRRSFNAIINNLKLSSKPQEISFLTFLSMPHERIGYRYKPKNKK